MGYPSINILLFYRMGNLFSPRSNISCTLHLCDAINNASVQIPIMEKANSNCLNLCNNLFWTGGIDIASHFRR